MRNVREVAKCFVFPMICVSAGSKSRLAKAAGAEVAGQSRQEKWHAAVARSTFQVKILKDLHSRSTVGKPDVKKWHAAVARSTFLSQNCKKLRVLNHFWKSRCRKIACRCGAKHISKSKFEKYEGSDPFLKSACRKMLEKCHEAVAPSTFASQN